MIDWLFTNALAALALAAIAGLLIWTFRPAPAVRHALWLIVLLKLVSPTGLVVEVPLPVDAPVPTRAEGPEPGPAQANDAVEVEVFTVYVHPQPGQSAEEAAVQTWRAKSEPAAGRARGDVAGVADLNSAPPPAESESSRGTFDYRPYLLGLWVVGAVAISWRQIRETARFARFTHRSLPAGDNLVAEVAIVANRLGVRVPAVRVMTGLVSPVIWCLWRPVLLWPAGLDCRLRGEGRRAVIAHELAHLRRRDHWVRRLEMVAAVLHWWNPVFWVARKKMRADAELACDAWAAGQSDRRAYAEALLEVCSFNPRRRPAPAVGVFGEGRRAMQERLTMIMRDRVPCRLAFGAKLVVALMAVAAVPAWTLGPGAEPVAAQDNAQMQEIEAQIKALAAKLEALKVAKSAEAQKKAIEAQSKAQIELYGRLKADAEKARALGEKMTREAIVHGQGNVKIIGSGEGGYKVIGPDGKEVKNVKIIITDPSPSVKPPAGKPEPGKPLTATVVPAGDGKFAFRLAADPAGQNVPAEVWTAERARPAIVLTTAGPGQSVTLSRATYRLSKDQAAALATLLGSIKATVMETKVDGESITVTTTPEAQASIGQIVRLVSGQPGGGNFRWTFSTTPMTPTTPTAPTKPSAPTKPTKPGEPAKPVEVQGLELKLDDLKKNLGVELKLDALKEVEKARNIKIEVEKLRDLEKLKDLKIELDGLKDLDKLKDLKIQIENLRDMQKLNELEQLRELKDVEKLKDAIKLLVPADRVKPGQEKKPEGPRK